MRTFVATAACFLSFVTAAAAETPPAVTLVGLWDSAQTSMGGIGETLEFRADGTFVRATTVIVNSYYRLVGDRLMTADKSITADAPQDQSPRIRIDKNTLTETDPKGSSVRKVRLGTSEEGKPPIVGRWRYRHYTGATAFERYTSEGEMFFRLPMTSSTGHYTLDENRIVLTLPNQPAVTMNFDLRGSELTLASEHPDKKRAYRRDTGGPWYDRQHIDYQPPNNQKTPR